MHGCFIRDFFSAAHRAQQYHAVDGCVFIRLSHTAKIEAIFQTESGLPVPLDGPKGDRAAEFPEKTARKLGIRFGGCDSPISTI